MTDCIREVRGILTARITHTAKWRYMNRLDLGDLDIEYVLEHTKDWPEGSRQLRTGKGPLIPYTEEVYLLSYVNRVDPSDSVKSLHVHLPTPPDIRYRSPIYVEGLPNLKTLFMGPEFSSIRMCSVYNIDRIYIGRTTDDPYIDGFKFNNEVHITVEKGEVSWIAFPPSEEQ